MEINQYLSPPPPPPLPPPPPSQRKPSSPFPITHLTSPRSEVAAASLREYLGEIGPSTRQNPADAWLPITESRGGNAIKAAFHTLCSGIGFQALALPVAFTTLGWTWGLICLVAIFSWQLYTLWLLTHLHQEEGGERYSRYLHLCVVAFGERFAKFLAKFPIMYLSGGTCTALIVLGGSCMKRFYDAACNDTCRLHAGSPAAIEWYMIFACIAAIVAQLPNLNALAGVSLIGAAASLTYCTSTWVISVYKGPVPDISYAPTGGETPAERALGIFRGIGIIAFAFRGHNLTLEIQGTMPSTSKRPSHVPMWRGVVLAYALIGLCLFPVAIGGYWAYGNKIVKGGILSSLHVYHEDDLPRSFLGVTTLLVVVNCLSSFQLYAMPVFDTLESAYTSRRRRPCPWWLRATLRLFFAALVFFIAVAIPFLSDLAALLGGVALPITLAYPCFMWAILRQPARRWLHWSLGAAGMGLSLALVGDGLWNLFVNGMKVHFFRAA